MKTSVELSANDLKEAIQDFLDKTMLNPPDLSKGYKIFVDIAGEDTSPLEDVSVRMEDQYPDREWIHNPRRRN